MTAVTAGILLPESVLTSGWFVLLGTIVAFNTLIYVGLTLSKLVPMPKQIHPRRVRRWLSRLGLRPQEPSLMTHIPVPTAPDSGDPYEQMRLQVARRDIPLAFNLIGALIICVSIGSALFVGASDPLFRLAEIAIGIAFLLAAQVLGRRHFSGPTLRWTWVLACALVVALMVWQSFTQSSLYQLQYTLIVLTAYAPITLAWRPAMAGGVLMVGAVASTSLLVSGAVDARIVLPAVAALLVGATLMRIRLTVIDALSRERARADALATTDGLTGVLSRSGLLTMAPGLAATAQRMDQKVCVMFCDVRALGRTNEDYGLGYGDEVLRAVADTIRRASRQGDLVARWGGDEFLVVGLGDRPDADDVAKRLTGSVRRTGVDLGKRPITIDVGTAAGDPSVTTLDALVARATSHLGTGARTPAARVPSPR